MDQSPTRASTPRPQISAAQDALDRLTFLGWLWGLTAIVAGMAASFVLFGYALIYWRNADMDLMVIYNALVINDGKPQLFFDHTGYITILSVKVWFKLLHALGLLGGYSLSAIPPVSDPSAFEAAMTDAVRAGRVLAFLIASGCVLVFAALMRVIVRDWRVALIATFAFAFSGGVAVHSRILRTELVAACPVIFALLILIAIGRRARVARPLGLAVAAALCVFGLENKVQAILLIGILPVLILPFGSAQGASVAFWRHPRSGWAAAIMAAVAAMAAAWAAWPLIVTGFDCALLDAAQFHPLLLGRFGIYQAALIVLIGGCMIAYAMIWRIGAAETLASMLAIAAGALLALLALNIEYNAGNVIAVFNPLEKMLAFADADTAAAVGESGLSGVLWLLLDGIASVLARYSLVLQLAAAAVDALGVRRGLKSEYFIFTDPLIILAGAIMLDSFTDLRFHKWAYPVALALLGLHIAVGQAEPVKYAFMRRGPEPICEWNRHYLPLLRLPWCPATAP